MTLVIGPGYKVKGGGKTVSITCSEDCLASNKDVGNFGGAVAEESRSCIVIKPATKTVSVLIGFQSGGIRENFTVIRSGDTTQ